MCVLIHINISRVQQEYNNSTHERVVSMAKNRKQLSFKENVRDLEILEFLEQEIIPSIGLSVYVKMLIEKDEAFIEFKKKNRS